MPPKPKRKLPSATPITLHQPSLRTVPVRPTPIAPNDPTRNEGVQLNPLETDEDVYIEKGRVTGRYTRYRTLNVFVIRRNESPKPS